MRPGDIMILLRARTHMMAPLIAGLKQRGVPVAGADRLELTEPLAVRDLLALMRFAVTPDDDLTLATVLRSPLFDVDEEGLFALAHKRPGRLWPRVREAKSRWPREARLLEEAIRDADFLRPYEFLEKALTTQEAPGKDGRRRLIARLGRDAEDPIDELLAQALTYETMETPTIEGFLGWLASGEVNVSREQEAPRNEVRVMTAHGAKGLQAPVVILPDTMSKPGQGQRDTVVELETPNGPRAVRAGKKGQEPEALARRREEIAAAEAAESRRLLYVAMTRAEDWLIVAGAGEDTPAKREGTWYEQVHAGMRALDAPEADAPGGGVMLTLEDEGEGKGGAAPDQAVTLPPAEEWTERGPVAGPPVRALKRKSASELVAHEAAGGAGLGREKAMLRGEAIHAALEHMPADLEAFERIVSGFAAPGSFDEDDLEALLAEADSARALPEAARFFAPGSVPEATISVELGGARVLGRIDRLIALPDEVAFVDFKSDAAPPASAAETPAGYLAQLAAYRAALAGIYPGRKITAHILWTAAPRLDQIDEALLSGEG